MPNKIFSHNNMLLSKTITTKNDGRTKTKYEVKWAGCCNTFWSVSCTFDSSWHFQVLFGIFILYLVCITCSTLSFFDGIILLGLMLLQWFCAFVYDAKRFIFAWKSMRVSYSVILPWHLTEL